MLGGVFFVLLCLFGEYFFLLVGFFGFFSRPSRQPAREPDGEPGSLCVRPVRMCAKSACVSVHGSVCV